MRQLPFDKLRLLRVGEWVALLTAVGLAVVAALRDSVALAGWSAAGVVLLLGGAALLAGRLAAALLVTRRQAEEQARALHESEIRTRTIVDTAADGIVTIDERGIVESFNAAAGRIFGYSADEVIGQSISLLMPSPEREEHQGHVAHHIRSGEAKGIGVARERVGLRKDGTAIPIESAVSEVRLPG
ncbi:MAG: PAS domain S-box protein, partial [bacterium]|nr:PAS domain S-box protein [bacterium]